MNRERQIAIIATGNLHKLDEIKKILSEFPFDIKSMKDVNLEGLEIVEDGNTFEENALIKARTVMKKTGYVTIADDSGLEVDCINNQPGIYSARFAGENANDAKNNEKLLNMMKDIPENERGARFVCAMAVVFPNGDELVLRGECKGIIGQSPRGKQGFGYDPLFIVPQYNLTFAELGEELKNRISHRAVALTKLNKLLEDKLRSE
ncbi:XTP/dITP diphosphohydrolase [Alkaliphilus peptidifermentans DSM 18978]|uniref:dITP/XTP pyrophosphatase n=1 Tax=Alkaliphilus peptidifermentans DSM 18978 TaxID=1120976 RepID=A0A1G5L578_9FIRM|nr:XTP/dITP diphosphatase [Alkaliphilus peptidifermentans]SCZ08025.1 XTP/dITP diphosphohydrolase [Alkaliphilus peptidifermentans DSM 18978]